MCAQTSWTIPRELEHSSPQLLSGVDLWARPMLSPPLLAHYKELQMGLSHLCREGDRATGASVWDWIPGELLVPDAPAQASPEYTLSVL